LSRGVALLGHCFGLLKFVLSRGASVSRITRAEHDSREKECGEKRFHNAAGYPLASRVGKLPLEHRGPQFGSVIR
jgi:hypothetical protein